MNIASLKSKVALLKETLANTKNYRKQWEPKVKPLILNTLTKVNKKTKLGANVEVKENLENLEVLILNLGKEESGIQEIIPDSKLKRQLIKSNGALVFQQLFNGKIMVMIIYPHIEGYGEPRPPKNLEIVRPDELNEGYILRYCDEFIKEIIGWEDYDDDQPSVNKIGFGTQQMVLSDEET
jgi:hypothetical protein